MLRGIVLCCLAVGIEAFSLHPNVVPHGKAGIRLDSARRSMAKVANGRRPGLFRLRAASSLENERQQEEQEVCD